MRTRTSWISVGQAGVVRIEIPVYTLGNGQPILTVTCSVHGDEQAGLYVAARLIENLTTFEKLNGTIHVIAAANPAAQFMNSRVSSLDYKDLNRGGRGREEGSLTDRTGARLFDFLSKCDFAVNIHEFQMHTPTTAVFMNAGNTETKTKTIAGIKAFDPRIIWVINSSQAGDEQYQTTLDTALAQAGVANFPIEMTQLPLLTETDIADAAQGLTRVAAHLGIIDIPYERQSSVAPAFMRQEFTTNDAGLWEPECRLMQELTIGDEIGTLRMLPDFQVQKILSPSEGILIQLRHRQLVSTGTGLFSIGRNADEIISPYL